MKGLEKKERTSLCATGQGWWGKVGGERPAVSEFRMTGRGTPNPNDEGLGCEEIQPISDALTLCWLCTKPEKEPAVLAGLEMKNLVGTLAWSAEDTSKLELRVHVFSVMASHGGSFI